MTSENNILHPLITSDFDAVGNAEIARRFRHSATKGIVDVVSDVMQRRSVLSPLVELDGSEIDLGVHGIQRGKALAQEGFFLEGNLQVMQRSLADAHEGDGIGEVGHDVVKVPRLGSGGTSLTSRGHFGSAGALSTRRIGTAS